MNRCLPSLALLAAALLPAQAAHAALPRFPQPYGDRIVFAADGNLWSVPKNGAFGVYENDPSAWSVRVPASSRDTSSS